LSGTLEVKQLTGIRNSVCFKDLQGSTQLIRARQSTSSFAMALNKENQNIYNKTLPEELCFRKQTWKKQGKGGLFEKKIIKM